ncbi:universal stress protein [bacterium SCSIO 12643]|nr:universal stress protein [bacterium SCSIO 12643]
MKVLVPTDFSSSARLAFDYGYQLVKGEENLEFVLLNSYEMPSGASAGGVMMSLEEAMAKESERDLALELKKMNEKYPDLKITTVSRYGTLENSIARTNNEEHIDLIVMGTHGASGLKKALIGSNTQAVIENVVRPVISVPSEWEVKDVKNIVYATDLKELQNLETLEPINVIADLADATIHIVYVTENASDFDLENEVTKLPLHSFFKDKTVKYKVIECDDVAEGIDSYVSEISADMVVTIPKEVSFWQKLFKRSVTEHMAFQSKVPLLSLKDQ